MPWTLSHSAAVLPLRRLSPVPLDFAALVIGSMTPDVGYYLRRFDLSQFAHSLPGSLLACLPTGVIMLCLFYFFCRPVCYALPAPHRQHLFPLCPEFPTSLARWTILLFSLFLGAWTHILWDAFTHENGWFVVRLPWLQEPVMQLGSTTIFMYLLMQELSTLVGFLIVLLAYRSWLHRQPALDPPPTRAPTECAICSGSCSWACRSLCHFRRQFNLHPRPISRAFCLGVPWFFALRFTPTPWRCPSPCSARAFFIGDAIVRLLRELHQVRGLDHL